jgi:aryl-alcohol dehydrogenase-like predicted oxidoreductase
LARLLGREILDPATLPEGEFRRQIPRFNGPDWALNRARIEGFRALARDLGLAPPALALAWVLDQGPHLIPIPGTRTADHLADWASADEILLTPEIRAEIERCLPVGWAYGDRYDDHQAGTVERYC